jgi:hypothetical protein
LNKDEADGIENAGPEALERAGREKDGDANHVKHEQSDTLQIDDENLAGERGDREEGGADEKYLDDEDGEERLKVSPEVIGTDAGVVGPWCERAEKSSEHHAGEGEDGGDEGTGPASAEVGELGDGLGKRIW